MAMTKPGESVVVKRVDNKVMEVQVSSGTIVVRTGGQAGNSCGIRRLKSVSRVYVALALARATSEVASGR